MSQLILAKSVVNEACDLFQVSNAKDLLAKVPSVIFFLESNYKSFAGSDKKELVIQIMTELSSKLPVEERQLFHLALPAIPTLVDEIVALAQSKKLFKRGKCFLY
jgi:hypothetical protein